MRLGILGTGAMAERMLATLAHRPQIRVTAIASATPARAQALAARAGAAACDPAELAARGDVDAVYIATRNAGHAAAALAAVAARKPALVEKPLAVSLPEARRAIDAARAARCLLVENLWTLALPATGALAARARGGPRLLQFDFGYPTRNPALYAPDSGVLRDRGGYGIALALHLFGPVDTLAATLRHAGRTDTAALIQMRHTSGDLSTLSVAFDALLSNTLTLSDVAGRMTLAPSIGAECLTVQNAPPYTAPDSGPARPSRLASVPALRSLNRWRKAPPTRTLGYGADPYLPMLDHFTALVAAGQSESPLVPLSLSLDVQRWIDEALSQGVP